MASTKEQAANQAKALLDQVWGDRGFPVDPVAIATELGIRVIVTLLPAGVSGAIERRKGEEAVIYLSVSDPPKRRRFTCAHELGHYVRFQEKEEVAFVDHRDGEQNEEEQFANAFAATLLMPEEPVIEMIKAKGIQATALWQLARNFDVSESAVRARVASLKTKVSS